MPKVVSITSGAATPAVAPAATPGATAAPAAVVTARARAAAFALWMQERTTLIKAMIAEAGWSMRPLPPPEELQGPHEHVDRVIVALTPGAATNWEERFEQLRLKGLDVAAAYGGPSRTMWLPLFIDTPPRSCCYHYGEQQHSSDHAAKVDRLEHSSMVGGKRIDETLDVAQFCNDRGWKRQNVTIRRKSGHQYSVSIRWPDTADLEEIRVRADCLVLALDQPGAAARIVDAYRRKNGTRSDKRSADAHWHRWEFVHYPDGRPNKPPKRSKSAPKAPESAGPAFGL